MGFQWRLLFANLFTVCVLWSHGTWNLCDFNGRERFWGSRYEDIAPTDIVSGQGLEIILRDIVNKPSRNTGRTTSRKKRSDPIINGYVVYCIPSWNPWYAFWTWLHNKACTHQIIDNISKTSYLLTGVFAIPTYTILLDVDDYYRNVFASACDFLNIWCWATFFWFVELRYPSIWKITI